MALCFRAGRVLEEKLDLKASFGLGMFATVFLAEVYAMLACFDYFLRECMTGKTICICSDNRAALLALSSHTVSSMLVFQCWNSLQGLYIHEKVQLFCVPGHCGIIWNDEPDGLARVRSSFCEPEPCLPIPKSLMTRVKRMVVR
jgi:hypothetical protein